MQAHINTNILWAAGNLSPWATGIDVFWHIDWSSVNYVAAILAHSSSKTNEHSFHARQPSQPVLFVIWACFIYTASYSPLTWCQLWYYRHCSQWNTAQWFSHYRYFIINNLFLNYQADPELTDMDSSGAPNPPCGLSSIFESGWCSVGGKLLESEACLNGVASSWQHVNNGCDHIK